MNEQIDLLLVKLMAAYNREIEPAYTRSNRGYSIQRTHWI